jgi:hypothetical protein
LRGSARETIVKELVAWLAARPGEAAVDAALRLLETGSTAAIEALENADLDSELELLHQPHDVASAHEQAITGSLAMLIDSGRFHEVRPGLFVAEGAKVAEQVVVRQGPVVVDTGAEIAPFVCLDGPVFIGRRARVNPHAWIRAATAIGVECRAGGEIEAIRWPTVIARLGVRVA